jgi:D-aminoacyl-tRNA deacylase
MKFLIVSSKEDLASVNLKEELFSLYKFEKKDDNLYQMDTIGNNQIFFKEILETHIYSSKEKIVENNKYNQIIFLSRHSTLSESKPKCMTVHAIGNWGIAEMGGKDHTVVKTDPILIRLLLTELKKNKPKEIKEFEVKQEATHHGPYLEEPTIFFEIGSQESDWKNKLVSKYMIKILINNIKDYNKEEIKNKNNWIEVIGVGGSHYCTKFNRLTFNQNNKYCFGHVVASYALKEIEKNKELLESAKEKSNSKIVIYEESI